MKPVELHAHTKRLLQIDALRGLAALAVVGFHLTTRFAEVYGSGKSASLSFPLGYYGVNLFFMISGFVIFMTLERTQRSMDFVVSRFSRLFPAYWVSVALTFGITHALGLPGREAGLSQAVLNLLMFHSLLGVPSIEGVYWTLVVELLFYVWMFGLFRVRQLANVHHWMIGLVGLRLLDFGTQKLLGLSIPWTIYELLNLKFIPWFALGVAIYALTQHQAGQARSRPAMLSMAVSLVSLLVTDSVFVSLLAVALCALLSAAATGRLRMLSWGPLVWLGSISYPLYLLHEYIGWSVMLALLRHGVGLDVAALVALGVGLLLAHGVSRGVELPALRWIRSAYKRHRSTQPANRLA